MDLIQMATDLALELQKDERYTYLDSARKMNDMDEELQEQIGRFNLARIDLNAELNKTERDTARVNELEERINSLYAEIMGNESMIAYNAAKTEMDRLLQYINAILSAAVNGGDPRQVPDPATCTGSCDGCSGCGY